MEQAMSAMRKELQIAKAAIAPQLKKGQEDLRRERALLAEARTTALALEAQEREFGEARAALLGSVETAQRQNEETRANLDIAEGMMADCSDEELKKKAKDWEEVLKHQELDAASQRQLDKLTKLSSEVADKLAEVSLVNSHREALSKQADVGDTSFFGSPRDAPSFGTARVKSSSQNDAAAFLRRVRATYEQTLQLQEVIIPSLDKRWDAACAERDRLKALKTDLSPEIEAAMRRDCEARKGIEPPPLEPWERAFIKMCEENTPPIVRDCRPMHQRTKPIPGAIPDDHYPQQTFVSQKVEEPKLATHVEGLKGAAAVPWAKVHREAVHRAKLETPSTPSTPAPAPAPATSSLGFGAAFGAALASPAPAPAAPSSTYPPMPSKPPSKLPFGTPAPAPAQKKKASPFGGAFALEGLGAALEAKAAAAGAAAPPPAPAPAPAAFGGFGAGWKSSSEFDYPENYCVDLREPPSHRADADTGTTSRRWHGLATPSSRCSYGDNIASMACSA